MKRIILIAALVLMFFSCCAQAETTYTLTVEYEGCDWPGYTEQHAAGEKVTLDPDLGVVRPDRTTGNHVGLDHWTEEDIPQGASAVAIAKGDHPESVNLQVGSFTMPARDVKLVGHFEERHVIVYKLYDGQKKGVQYHCLPGAKTPSFARNGSDPVRDGYVFDGWKSAPGETMTGSITCVAQWKKPEPVTVQDEGGSKLIRIPVDHKAFDPENLYANGKKLTHHVDFEYYQGSTIIKLLPAYLEKQPEGSTIEIEAGFFTNSDQKNEESSRMTVTVSVPVGPAAVRLPQTGDSSRLAFWCGMLAAALAAGAAMRRRKEA